MDMSFYTFELRGDQVFLDGTKIRGVRGYKLEQAENDVPLLTLQLYVEPQPTVRIVGRKKATPPDKTMAAAHAALDRLLEAAARDVDEEISAGLQPYGATPDEIKDALALRESVERWDRGRRAPAGP
jgi:hypothetical protein